ncbi:hypothetical protein FALBO_9113 [Fusarium albosuccineum]|uniref:Uncharacterized protein n=1 Tax=Fusarium albosuccineum TaxID=1237068 RepID=A0A8H4L6N3_9HYPO|nr:hypothetical protein FALBO_9113 [Fusarium albosuccineum]
MRYSHAVAGLLTVALSTPVFAQTPVAAPVEEPSVSVIADPAPADDCNEACVNSHEACLTGAGSITEVCDQELTDCQAECNGPVTPEPVTPAPVTPAPTGDACAQDCATKHDACNSAPDANHASCAADYASCLGYNPYENDVFVEPTACSHGPTPPAPTMTDTPEVCCVQCTTVYKSCCDAAGDVIDHCKAEYTVCLGYNPFDIVPYVEPTVCKHNEPKPPKPDGPKPDVPKGTPAECCVQCTTVYKECCTTAGGETEECKVEYTTCLGYNPSDVSPWVEPSACKHDGPGPNPPKGDKPPTGKVGPPKAGDSDSTSTSTTTKTSTITKTGTDEECCVKCTTTYKACCDAAGDVIEHCKTAYTTCLGYNPFEGPWVEPTVCKHGGSDDDVVIVSGGESLRPALALLALGAIALLCEYLRYHPDRNSC